MSARDLAASSHPCMVSRVKMGLIHVFAVSRFAPTPRSFAQPKELPQY
jgi:hypothetical protein